MQIKCPVCDYTCNGLRGLSKHVGFKHELTDEALYRLIHTDEETTYCACGCGIKTNFKSLSEGYSQYLKGHHRRIHKRPPGLAPDCACGCGERVEWLRARGRYNKYVHGHNSRGVPSPFRGQTKETCDKFKRQSETILANEGERRRRSEQWRTLHRIGKIPVGIDHHNWKGGTTGFGDVLTGHPRLYKEWKLPYLKNAGFKCQLCSKSNNLHVHHDDEAMHMIVSSQVADHDKLDGTAKTEAVNKIIDYHIDNNVSGVVLCAACHKTLHSKKGYITARHYFDEIYQFVVEHVHGNIDITVDLNSSALMLQTRQLIISYGDLFRTAAPIVQDRSYLVNRHIINDTNMANVQYLHIFEDEWRDKQDIVKSMIKARLGTTQFTYDARKLQLRQALTSDKKRATRKFFDDNHIDGGTAASHAWMLHDDDDVIVAALTLRTPRPRRWRDAGYMELARFASLRDSRVRGGLSRLVSAARHELQCPIMTYVDMRHGTGAAYINAGFKLHGTTGMPRFWWTDFHDRRDRFRYRADSTRGMSESAVAAEAGVVKIWGCVNRVYTLR